jgi:hypothetical protein
MSSVMPRLSATRCSCRITVRPVPTFPAAMRAHCIALCVGSYCFRVRPDFFLCHDYKAPGRSEYQWETTVAAERAQNVHIRDGVGEDEFVQMRTIRDAQLGMPKLIMPSVQVNMRAGDFPPAENHGQIYLKIPLNKF